MVPNIASEICSLLYIYISTDSRLCSFYSALLNCASQRDITVTTEQMPMMGSVRRQRRREAKHIPCFWVLPGTELHTGEPFPQGSWSCFQPCEIQWQNYWSVKKFSQWKHRQAATKEPLYSLRSSVESDFSHKIVCTSMSHLGRKGKPYNLKEQRLYLICWLLSWNALVSLTFA